MNHCMSYEWEDGSLRHTLYRNSAGNLLVSSGTEYKTYLILTDEEAENWQDKCYKAKASKVKQNTPWSTVGTRELKLVREKTEKING